MACSQQYWLRSVRSEMGIAGQIGHHLQYGVRPTDWPDRIFDNHRDELDTTA